jgi:hypothetical protein
MTQDSFIPIAAAPEHREPTATKRGRSEWLMCVDCAHVEDGEDAAKRMRQHKIDSKGRCT